MAGARIKVTLDAVQADGMLRQVEAGARNALPLFTEIGSTLEASTRERIGTTKTAPDGTPWLDLTPSWVDRKQKRGYSAGILTMRGDLLNSVANEPTPNYVDIIAGPTEYAAIHQHGGTSEMSTGAAAIPARPYMGLSAEDQVDIDEATSDWLAGLVAG